LNRQITKPVALRIGLGLEGIKSCRPRYSDPSTEACEVTIDNFDGSIDRVQRIHRDRNCLAVGSKVAATAVGDIDGDVAGNRRIAILWRGPGCRNLDHQHARGIPCVAACCIGQGEGVAACTKERRVGNNRNGSIPAHRCSCRCWRGRIGGRGDSDIDTGLDSNIGGLIP
jgi:hypothetical protein